MDSIKTCRICGSSDLREIFKLERMALTGVFPKNKDDVIPIDDMTLVACGGSCGVVQLKEIPSPFDMYGDNYGYRSGLNQTMVDHLGGIVKEIENENNFEDGDCVLDIGSNDATLLNAYTSTKLKKIGIDPSGGKFKHFYVNDTRLIVDFFSEQVFREIESTQPKVITSISMFYDLPEPLDFVEHISKVLHPDGIWVTEQSYLPFMIQTNSFDTICQEHLEYYDINSIKWMLDQVGLKITNINFNSVNGGSSRITITHKNNRSYQEYIELDNILAKERSLNKATEFKRLGERIAIVKTQLFDLISATHKSGGKVYGLGASTKGNTLLQHFGLSNREICCIGEVNEFKIGSYTPGSTIPILSEEEVLSSMTDKDIAIILPWHFREYFLTVSRFKNKNIYVPLPNVEQIHCAHV